MTGLAECLECGRVTARALPARFPHVCLDCLFPDPVDPDPFRQGKPVCWTEMLEQLHRAAAARPNLWRDQRGGR